MVRRDLAARGIHDERVLAAMGSVRREYFVDPAAVDDAYADCPLPIGCGQTISQPYIVGLMSEAAEVAPGDRVLEIGTGSGYGAAVLAELGADVWTMERHHDLVARARRALADLGYDRVRVLEGDGSVGWAPDAPYDAILVTASAPRVPEALWSQLAEGGRLVMPVGAPGRGETLVRLRRVEGRRERDDLGGVRFVPLIGEQGVSPR
jgi:protein-L-isoaspartate(D-aspartate) O-methyltransferase